MEAVKTLGCSREELSGVWGVERSEGGGGNWRGPPRPDGLRAVAVGVPSPITASTGSGHRVGWASEAVVVERGWTQVRANKGAPGIDRSTLSDQGRCISFDAQSRGGLTLDLPDQRKLNSRCQCEESRPALQRWGRQANGTWLRDVVPVLRVARLCHVHPGSGKSASMNADELDAHWRSLGTPDTPEQLEARIVAADIWVAVDHIGRRHLLLKVPDETTAPPTTTRGLLMTVARHQVAGEQSAEYLDLTCLSDDVIATFTAVAAEIGNDADPVTQVERVAAVAAALSRWQWFWGVESGRMSEREVLGLFAELWFLHRWAHRKPGVMDAWTASTGSRHDFQWSDCSVEVKAATRRADGAVLHRIQHLDQLADPEEGELLLFSLLVVRDRLAHNTLADLVDRITAGLRGYPQSGEEFAHKLSLRDYNPAHRALYEEPFRILGEHLYTVAPGFPRLTVDAFAGGLPVGVEGVSYVIDMAVCNQWLVASSPDEWGAGGSDSTPIVDLQLPEQGAGLP